MDWLEDYQALRVNGKLPEGSNMVSLLERRLKWEIWSEYTFDCRIGRTLEKTGSSTLEVKPDVWQRTVETLLPRLRERIGPLRDLAMFNAVALDQEVGTLTWPNGADFDPATLHEWPAVRAELAARAQAWTEPTPNEPRANTRMEPTRR